MMETLEQQQTKITSNIAAQDRQEDTTVGSEEDDYDECSIADEVGRPQNSNEAAEGANKTTSEEKQMEPSQDCKYLAIGWNEETTKQAESTEPKAEPEITEQTVIADEVADEHPSTADAVIKAVVEDADTVTTIPEVEVEAIKVESFSDDEQTAATVASRRSSTSSNKKVEDLKTKLYVAEAPKIKVNGAHAAMRKASDNEMLIKEEEQLPVIENNKDDSAKQQEQPMPLPSLEEQSTIYSTVNGVDSDSSASQQLVIDHAESEQQAKVLPLKLSLKRRRSGSTEQRQLKRKPPCKDQQQRPLETTSADKSLLLQRLQQPLAMPHNEVSSMLSCFKCNAHNFDNFQQLNEHSVQCNVLPAAGKATTTTVETTATVAPAAIITTTTITQRRLERFFRCARCSTVHQCWNFFLHMRDVHQRYICLYCSHVYATVEKLSLHLENKHDIDQSHFVNDTWTALQRTEDRTRHLICCTCQATFERGSRFEEHDCAELMQPCTLCGQKGCHTNGCRNGSNKKPVGKRKRKVKRKKQAPPPAQPTQATIEQSNIPATNGLDSGPLESSILPATPKLVVPKIMLRVPKEFQKSVDAALSSTDTEEEEHEPEATELARQQPTFEAQAMFSEDTETATETSAIINDNMQPTLLVAVQPYDSPTAKLTRVLEEIERTKLDIQRTKADMLAKKQPKVLVEAEQALPPTDERRWSPTPPASPHNNSNSNHMATDEAFDKQTPTEAEPEMEVALEQEQTQQEQPLRRATLGSDCMELDVSLNEEEQQPQPQLEQLISNDLDIVTTSPIPPADGIEVAGSDTHTVDLQLDRPLDKFEMVDFVRLCLNAFYPLCLYCNHARRIAVNGKQLLLHIIAQHRFTATVDSITAEELHAETIVAKLKSFLPLLEHEHLNAASYCSVEPGRFVVPYNERVYECFQCRYVASTHKELYTHNRRLHIKTNILCHMCRANFYSFSEILCHICPGVPNGGGYYDLQFRCCLCTMTQLPSAFRLMVHLRKQHQACDICLEDCHSQSKLSSHVWKHKLLHLCYRCGIAYRNKQDISKHLFWKHGTESSSCKRCLQKRWRHVYHFCVPPPEFTCELCQYSFSKAIYLEVHKRMHNGDFRYACAEDQCLEKFVSRRLLLKHANTHEHKPEEPPQVQQCQEQTHEAEPMDQKEIKKEEEQQTPMAAAKSSEALNAEPKAEQELPTAEAQQLDGTPRKRRKKLKRNKLSLEDLNLIAPNLSETDSSDESDTESQAEAPTLPLRAAVAVDDLDMPRVMLSPASESDNEEPVQRQAEKPDNELDQQSEKQSQPSLELEAEAKAEAEVKHEKPADIMPDIWKTLLQLKETPQDESNFSTSEDEPCPSRLHVVQSDHDYCKLHMPMPAKERSTPKSSKRTRHNSTRRGSNDSDSDSSSSSSSNSGSSSCSCGSNCSCSSSSSGGSSSSDSSSDDSDSSVNTPRSSPLKRGRKKSVRNRKAEAAAASKQQEQQQHIINVTEVEEQQRPPTPPKLPIYNESDFDTAVSDTDEEFYDAHPQQMASELLAQKRAALLGIETQLSNYDIVENSRPSTPSLPEELATHDQKRERARNKKKKRERKSTCKSVKTTTSQLELPLQLLPPPPLGFNDADKHTPLTHRLQPALARMSEGSSCSDADGNLKRSKRQRRPNKFYGYTSDDENMSSVLAPPLQVGMQLIKPQPPPQLTWAKEDLPTPAKSIHNQVRSKTPRTPNTSAAHPHLHSNGTPSGPGAGGGGGSRKRNKRPLLSGGGDKNGSTGRKRNAKRPRASEQMPPIPTLKIRPALLAAAAGPNDNSSDSSSGDEDAEINVTSLLPAPHVPSGIATPQQQQLNSLLPPPPAVLAPAPAATAFNQPIPPALLPNPDFATLQYFKANNIRYPIRPPAGARLAREGESVYCYCRCPYDEVSEMIACDGDNCLIEWFHFECVGIMVAPQGKWFCAECRPKYSEGLYPKGK